MARYIDAETLLEFVKQYTPHINGETTMECVETAILNAPTADVVEVKHGEWVLHTDGSGTCKICNTHQKDIWDMDNWQNFCGHCGAKMDGRRDT